MDEIEELFKKYTVLLDLYAELESVSENICRALETGSSLAGIAGNLREKKEIVERIGHESETIACLKKTIADRKLISDAERVMVRNAEEDLTEAVSRVVDQGQRTCELMMKQGVKVSRR
ncbi:hypothetical protein LLG96_05130 [bacterium]|nr:hypothetical protein [bacterium]